MSGQIQRWQRKQYPGLDALPRPLLLRKEPEQEKMGPDDLLSPEGSITKSGGGVGVVCACPICRHISLCRSEGGRMFSPASSQSLLLFVSRTHHSQGSRNCHWDFQEASELALSVFMCLKQ